MGVLFYLGCDRGTPIWVGEMPRLVVDMLMKRVRYIGGEQGDLAFETETGMYRQVVMPDCHLFSSLPFVHGS